MSDWQTHETRSQTLADSVRRYLVAAHTGGIATAFAIAGALATNHVHPSWAIPAVALFAVGLVLAGVSMLLAQHREMKRRQAAKNGAIDPEFRWWWWSWTWNSISLGMFVLAVVLALIALGNVTFTAGSKSGEATHVVIIWKESAY